MFKAIIALVALGVTGCSAPLRDHGTTRYFGGHAAIPSGCAVGISGPTIRPGDAIYYAEADALAALAAGSRGVQVDIRAVQVQVQGGSATQRFRQVIRQFVRGRMTGARIMRLWHDTRGRGSLERRDVVYALACDEEGAGAVGPWSGFEEMLDTVGRPCALGVAGPTLLSDQQEAAFADARARLAELMAVDVESLLVDFDLTETALWQSIRSPEGVKEAVEERATLARYTIDERGTGPLGMRGVAYALACLDGETRGSP